MALHEHSGASTPLSTTTTLSAPPSPRLKTEILKEVKASLVSASTAIEFIASRSTSSSSVFIYDVAEQVGFGTLTKSWATTTSESASVVELQTRAGAGLSLVGRLSQGTSKDATNGAVLTAYTTPSGLAAMAQSLSYLPAPAVDSRLIIQVPTVTPVGESFALSPTLAPLTSALALLPESFTILLSATPQEALEFATLAYKVADSHIIHLFDHHGAARETGHDLVPTLPEPEPGLTIKEGLSKAGFGAFEYTGDSSASTVIVLLNGPLALVAKAIVSRAPGLGVVTVKVLRPWDEEAFRAALPASVKHIHVLDDVPTESAQGALYVDVFASVLDPLGPGPVVKSHRIVPAHTQEFLTKPSTFMTFVAEIVGVAVPEASVQTNRKNVLFFSTPGTQLASPARGVEQTFIAHHGILTRLVTDHDVFSKPGGITADRLILSDQNETTFVPASVELPISPDSTGVANLVAILDQTLLKSHSVFAHALPGSPVLIATTWTAAELVSSLPRDVVSLIRERNLRVCLVNPAAVAAKVGETSSKAPVGLENIILQVAFLRLYLGQAGSAALAIKILRSAFGDSVQGVALAEVGEYAWNALVEVEIPAPEALAEGEAAKPNTLKNFSFNAISVETVEGETVVNGARVGSWHDAAKHIIFPSAFTPSDVPSAEEEYAQDPALRPEVPERTYLVTCTVNRRLTPLDYDRNVFHLEFDTRGTGLKYEIGEALGVHGWNDAEEVLDFCRWYGADPNRLITIPVPNTDGTRLHTRTVYQALQQQIDLFGKPGKAFYADLAEYATVQADKMALKFIGSPEGSSTFKKLSEKDTVTFADILKRYTSARPGIEVLCELVGDIKPRHYSIASAQAVVGDQVDLLVVSVDWVTPSGTPRYGQCTRYLAGLKVGQKVTVSLRPSVMKLPPDNMQPIIMAGLGTGAAPFRAFLQYRAWLQAQNIPTGPTYYYFGSRHRSQEYLYGEELEAFIADGVLTKAGLAFSRDGPKKVYIQHKMKEDADDLARMLWDDKGVFYLCGPTWPVPDVYEALVGALVKRTGQDAVHAGEYLESLKEEERYVLEVY
ncbi:assimilatory sulfite reductase [Wolfiporia cocos MD-104 SS10]|uniref:assimilatory sulfite reductase (NADPH) n=1 Tax=Wolfiporia cocos (strain MD-104) TaxID=742152 RepID=A0A2H3JU01_WOLCO|nr:assimilatory sulfite reductase [Wolfiporia cocos MD-104 SS10]